MSAASLKIRDEVRHLPFGERLRLVKELEEDLDFDKPSEEAWDHEEQSRVDEILSGQVQLMSGEDLTRRLDEVLARHIQ